MWTISFRLNLKALELHGTLCIYTTRQKCLHVYSPCMNTFSLKPQRSAVAVLNAHYVCKPDNAFTYSIFQLVWLPYILYSTSALVQTIQTDVCFVQISYSKASIVNFIKKLFIVNYLTRRLLLTFNIRQLIFFEIKSVTIFNQFNFVWKSVIFSVKTCYGADCPIDYFRYYFFMCSLFRQQTYNKL